MQGLWIVGLKQWAKHAPFYQLRDALVKWNKQRLALRGANTALNGQDIATIRQLLEHAQQQSPVKITPTLFDQWFFLAIGAIQIQSQTGSHQAWHLFDQSVHTQLSRPILPRALSLGLLASLCVVWMAFAPIKHRQVAPMTSPLETIEPSAGGTVDPVTLSLLNLAYQKMQNGSCQLPQAAMLPETQRQAFILFVTAGKVEVDQVEPLRQALGYVSCLYPQELMRPQGRDRNLKE